MKPSSGLTWPWSLTRPKRRAAHLAFAHFAKHNYEAALDAMRQVPDPGFTQELYFAAILAMLGRDDEAAAHRDKALAVNPDISVSWAVSHTPFAGLMRSFLCGEFFAEVGSSMMG